MYLDLRNIIYVRASDTDQSVKLNYMELDSNFQPPGD